MRTSKPRRTLGARVFLETEPLEARFLCAADPLTPLVVYSERLTSGGAFDAAFLPAQLPLSGGSSAAAAKMVPTEAGNRMDTFILPAGDDVPEIRAWLSWGTAPELADGSLVVLDTAGATLYRFPIGQVGELHAEIQAPAWPGDATAGMHLDLDLQIRRGPVGSTTPGFYSLALAWKPGPASAPPGLAPGPGTSIPSGQALVPAAEFGPDAVGGGNTTGGGLVGATPIPPPSLTVLDRPLPAAIPSSGLGGIPMGPERPSAPTTGGVPVVVGGHGPGTPLGPTPDLGRAAADRGSAVIVGPLPLGRSAPDGGIFERSFAATAAPHASDSLVTRTSLGMAPSLGLPTAANGPNEVGKPPHRRRPVEEAPGPGQASGEHVPPDDRRDPDEAPRGLILLPPLRLARARPQPPVMPPIRIAPPRTAARLPGSRGPWWSPVAATVVVGTGSAILVLKLNAPTQARAPRS